MVSLIFALLTFIAALIYNVFRNYGLIWAYNKVNHVREGFVKGATLLPSLILFTFHSEAKLWIAFAVSFWMICSWFWLGFDGLLNVSRQYNFWFTGSEDGKDDAKTDNFLQSIPLWLHIFIKVALVVISTFVYIKLYD